MQEFQETISQGMVEKIFEELLAKYFSTIEKKGRCRDINMVHQVMVRINKVSSYLGTL